MITEPHRGEVIVGLISSPPRVRRR